MLAQGLLLMLERVKPKRVQPNRYGIFLGSSPDFSFHIRFAMLIVKTSLFMSYRMPESRCVLGLRKGSGIVTTTAKFVSEGLLERSTSPPESSDEVLTLFLAKALL